MVFIKVQRTAAYSSRFQVQFRRRREGKTDFQQRKALIIQDKSKYSSPKYRLVIRFSNKDVICQVIYARVTGDIVLAAAYSHELPRYGVKCGLKNYAAAYCTGLLLARRTLQKLKLDAEYPGAKDVTGEDYNVEESAEGRRPFRCYLDVGLRRTTTGSRIFAALKGACDGGLDVPHSVRRFVGYDEEKQELDAKVLRQHIMGGHIAEYMKLLQKEQPDEYQKRFSQFVKNGVKPEDVETMYKKAHAAIRADPAAKKGKTHAKPAKPVKRPGHARISRAQRRGRAQQILAVAIAKFEAEAALHPKKKKKAKHEEEEEEEEPPAKEEKKEEPKDAKKEEKKDDKKDAKGAEKKADDKKKK